MTSENRRRENQNLIYAQFGLFWTLGCSSCRGKPKIEVKCVNYGVCHKWVEAFITVLKSHNLSPSFREFSCLMFSGNHVYLLFIQTFHFHQPLLEEHMFIKYSQGCFILVIHYLTNCLSCTKVLRRWLPSVMTKILGDFPSQTWQHRMVG